MKTENIKMALRHLNNLDYAINLKRCFDELEELERLARIGKATEKAFEKTDIALFTTYWRDEDGENYVDNDNSYQFDCVEDLLEWAEREDE